MPIYGMPPNSDQMPYVEPHPQVATAQSAFSANEATFNRVRVSKPATVSQMTVLVGTASGNIDLGIYQSDGTTLTLLASTGSTAMSGATTAQSIALSASVTFQPGIDYYLAFSVDNGTGTIRKIDLNTSYMGIENRILKKTGTFPLPASITIASMAAGGWMMNIMARP